ncbi:hypothetical protein ACXJY6_05145 [Vibrio sp. RC27]
MSNDVKKEEKSKKVYSPMQISIGTYLGGPLAAIYFLKVNFDTLGKKQFSNRTLFYGSLIVLCLILLVPFLSLHLSSSIIPLLYLFPTMFIAHKYQLTRDKIDDSKEFDMQPYWLTVVMTVVWMIAYLVVAVLAKQAFIKMGITGV